MDARDFFRSFFGFPKNRFDQRDAHEVPDDFENDDEHHEEDHHFGASRRNDQPFGDNFVQVFTNPLEMERFFNSQMESILKGFGISDGFFSFPNESPNQPAIQGPSGDEDLNVEPGSRDFMLKEGNRGRGFLPPPDKNQPLRDDVLDKITINDLDELYTDDGHYSHSGVDVPPGGNGFVGPFGPGGFGGLFGGAFGPALPFHGSPPGFGPQNREDDEEGSGFVGPFGRTSTFSFGRSVTQSRVVMPDGTVEERRTVRDSDGNETSSVTRTVGGKTETIATTRKPKGYLEGPESGFCGPVSRLFGPKNDGSAREEMLKPIPEFEQPAYKSIFSKLFGK